MAKKYSYIAQHTLFCKVNDENKYAHSFIPGVKHQLFAEEAMDSMSLSTFNTSLGFLT